MAGIGKLYLAKHISCNLCDTDSKQVLVFIKDIKIIYAYIMFGCTINELPNAGMYYKTEVQNEKKYFYYTNLYNGCQVPYTPSYNLIVPSISS